MSVWPKISTKVQPKFNIAAFKTDIFFSVSRLLLKNSILAICQSIRLKFSPASSNFWLWSQNCFKNWHIFSASSFNPKIQTGPFFKNRIIFEMQQIFKNPQNFKNYQNCQNYSSLFYAYQKNFRIPFPTTAVGFICSRVGMLSSVLQTLVWTSIF